VEGKLNESSLCFLGGAILDLNTRANVLDYPFPATAFSGWPGRFKDRFPHHLPCSGSDELFGYIVVVKECQGFGSHAVDTRVVGLVHLVISGIEIPKMSDPFINLCQCEISLTTAFEMVHNRPLEPLRAETLSNTIV
jgi:hypothetical protein